MENPRQTLTSESNFFEKVREDIKAQPKKEPEKPTPLPLASHQLKEDEEDKQSKESTPTFKWGQGGGVGAAENPKLLE